MGNENNVSKPIPDQIMEEVLVLLKKQKDFDDQTIADIEGLWRDGGLKRAERIIRVIRPGSDE